MNKTKQFHRYSSLSRLLVVTLCFLMLFGVLTRPVRVYAATAFYDVALNYTDTAKVAPYLIPFILIIVGLDWYYSNIDDIVAQAESLYNNASTAVKSWAESCASQIIDGTSAFKIDTAVREEINSVSVGSCLEDDDKYVVVPQDLLRLGSLSATDVFTADATELLRANNTLLQKVEVSLNAVRNTLVGSFTSVNENLFKVKSSIENLWSKTEESRQLFYRKFNDLTAKVEEMRQNVWGAVKDTTAKVEELRLNLQTYLNMVANRVSDSATTLVDKLEYVRGDLSNAVKGTTAKVEQMRQNLQTYLNMVANKTTASIESLETKLDSIFAPGIITAPSFAGSITQSVTAEGALAGNSSEGKDQTLYYIGQGKDLLSKYYTAFLAVGAVLTKFFNVPILGDIVTFSLALGIFALIVNLGNTLISKSSESSAKGIKSGAKKSGALKGG